MILVNHFLSGLLQRSIYKSFHLQINILFLLVVSLWQRTTYFFVIHCFLMRIYRSISSLNIIIDKQEDFTVNFDVDGKEKYKEKNFQRTLVRKYTFVLDICRSNCLHAKRDLTILAIFTFPFCFLQSYSRWSRPTHPSQQD